MSSTKSPLLRARPFHALVRKLTQTRTRTRTRMRTLTRILTRILTVDPYADPSVLRAQSGICAYADPHAIACAVAYAQPCAH
eukprot:9690966-Alexandrium_andersonii.AAC.1